MRKKVLQAGLLGAATLVFGFLLTSLWATWELWHVAGVFVAILLLLAVDSMNKDLE